MKFRRLASIALLPACFGFAAPRLAAGEDKPAAPATDAASQVKALLAEIDVAEKAKDDGALSSAAKKIPALYKGTQDGALRSQMAKALAGMLKNPKLSSSRKSALDALAETEDGKEAWKAMQSQYPADDVEDTERFNVDFVKTVGKLHPDGAIDKLLETFKKAKQNEFSAEAVTALGQYHKSKQRERILEEVCKAGKNMVPSRSANKNPSPEAQTRWANLAPAIGKALDQLTGDSVGDPTEWFKRFDDSKKNLKALFKD